MGYLGSYNFSKLKAFNSIIQIVTVDEHTKEYVDYYGKKHPYGNETYQLGDCPKEFIFFTRSNQATGVAYVCDFDVPKVDYMATIYERDVINT